MPVVDPALRFLTELLKTINLHLEATPPEQRAALAARWNSFWAQVGDRILKPAGIELPPMPDIPPNVTQEESAK